MPIGSLAERSSSDWIKLACWLVIGVFVISRIAGVVQGQPLWSVLDLSNLGLIGTLAALALIVRIFMAPRLVKAATMIEPNEIRTVVVSFSFVFILMAAYYILRPVRDAMASDWSNTEISILWNIQLVLSTVGVALYGLACSHVRFRLLVPAVYIFFALTFCGFYLGSGLVASGIAFDGGLAAFLEAVTRGPITNRILLDKSFYLWVSLFSLFHVSVFWSFMADTFSKEQSRRVFAFIAAGASAGAAAGPLVANQLVSDIGTDNLMLVASAMLLVAIPVALYLQRLKRVDLHNEDVTADLSAAKIGGNPLAGFKTFFTNPYLLAIGAFILLYTTIGSFVYFQQTDLLREFTREQRTEILAGLAFVVNLLTFGLGLFATSRIVTRFGMSTTLALVPVFICAGLLILAFAPILTILLALQVARQAGNYGITRPAREMLFTNVDRETRFKAKPVIDVAVYRGGDAASSIAFAGLTDGLGLGIAAMAAIGAGIAAVWGAAGVYLGRVFGRTAGVDVAEGGAIAAVPQRQAAT